VLQQPEPDEALDLADGQRRAVRVDDHPVAGAVASDEIPGGLHDQIGAAGDIFQDVDFGGVLGGHGFVKERVLALANEGHGREVPAEELERLPAGANIAEAVDADPPAGDAQPLKVALEAPDRAHVGVVGVLRPQLMDGEVVVVVNRQAALAGVFDLQGVGDHHRRLAALLEDERAGFVAVGEVRPVRVGHLPAQDDQGVQAPPGHQLIDIGLHAPFLSSRVFSTGVL